jgi:succinoglycan biosynthesis protein ExoA
MNLESNLQASLVSLILPIRNEVHCIQRSVEAVFHQDYPLHNMEVLVADGMSDDGTRDIVLGYQQKFPNVKLIDNPGKIVSTGMNAALRVANGEIIIRVDGHTIISTDYVRQCIDALHSSGADNVGGRMNAIGKGTFGEAVALATSSPFGVGGARFHYSTQEEWVDTVYMGTWGREVFDKIGLFDEELVRDQDDEFNYRLREAGGKIFLSPKIKSNYYVRSSPSALWNQYYQYGYWKVRVLQKHPKQMRLRQFIPPVFTVVLILSLLMTFIFIWGWIIFTLVMGSYLGLNLTASFITASKKGWKHFSILPLTFVILHLSYGLGFLIGLIKFANRWGDKIGKTPIL